MPDRHEAAEFAAASDAYADALVSGVEERIAAADERLDNAERAYLEALARRVRTHQVRASLPSFVAMLAHPWSQPPEVPLARHIEDGGIVYPSNVPSNTIDARGD